VEMKKNPIFMIGVVFGAALTHAQNHVNKEYPFASEQERNVRIEHMTNLMLSEFTGEHVELLKATIKP